MKLTFFHGSHIPIEGSSIKANAICLGNKLEDPSWAVYMWRNKDNAYTWALFRLIRDVCNKHNKNIFDYCGLDLLSDPIKVIIMEEGYSQILKWTVGLKCYVYTVEADLFDLGLGQSTFLPEFISKSDTKIIRREEITVTSSFLHERTYPLQADSVSEWIRKHYFSKFSGVKSRGLPSLLMHGDDYVFPIQKRIWRKMEKGKVKPGDDLKIIVADVKKEMSNETWNKIDEGISPVIESSDIDPFDDVEKIYASLNAEDRAFLSPTGRFIDSPNLVYRKVYYDHNEPIGYGELIDAGKLPKGIKGDLVFNFAVRKEYRGKGYGKRILRDALAWYKKSKFTSFTHRCDMKNIASAKTAESLGLKRYPQNKLFKEIRDTEYVYYHDKREKKPLTEGATAMESSPKHKDSSNLDFIRRSGYFNTDNSVFITDKIKSSNSYVAEDLSYISEASTGTVHTDKLDLSKMYFITGAHEPGTPPTNNSALELGGKKYRVRVETLILNDKGEIYASKRGKPTNMGAYYKIPGGSLEPDKSIEEQAAAESREEVRAHVKNLRNTGVWYTNLFDDNNLSADKISWLKKAGLKYDGFITIVCVADYAGRFSGRVAKEDRVDWINSVKFYPQEELGLIPAHKLALGKVNSVKEAYSDINPEDIGYEFDSYSCFVTEGASGTMTYDYPLNTLNVKKFKDKLPGLTKADLGRGYRGLIHCRLQQPVAIPTAFVNIKLSDGSIQASHGDPIWIGKAKAKILRHAPEHKKKATENTSRFITDGQLVYEETALKNPYNGHGNIKLTRRVDHKQQVKHPTLIRKQRVHENYTDFF